MEHDKQAEEDHEEVEKDEEEDEEEQDTLFEVPPGAGDKSDSDGFVDSEEEAFEGDDMSEDGLGLGPTPQEQETVLLSSSEDEARKVQRKSAKKRKGQAPSRLRSAVWTFFHKVEVPSKEGLMELKAQCNYCDNQYAYVQGGSTSSMGRHMDTCKNYKDKVNRDLIQATLFFRKTNATTSGPAVQCIEYDKDLIKEVMAKMICVHEYSFRMVEHKWFNILMKCLNPNYQPIGRKAIRAECMRVFKKERELLQVALKDVDFISLTTDLWTSNQTISYMCVVAHFIDKDWKMQTRVICFIDLDPPHSGHVISDAIYECVTEWKIEKKIISITLDNASNNDVAVRGLKAKFAVRRGIYLLFLLYICSYTCCFG